MITYTKDDLLSAEREFRKLFVNGLTGYKSAFLIGTKSKESIENVAIFSNLMHVGANPPQIGIQFRPDTVQRDTLTNLRESGICTLNLVTFDLLERAHMTSGRIEGSEFEHVGVTPTYQNSWDAPFVEGSTLQSACRLAEEHRLGNGCLFVVLNIEWVSVAESAVDSSGQVAMDQLDAPPISGLRRYYRGTPFLDMERD